MKKAWYKKMSVLVLCIFALAILAGCGGGQQSSDAEKNQGNDNAAPKKIVLKLGHDHMTSSPFQKSAEKFKELVEARSNGQIEVQIYPAQQLGSSREMIEGLQMGTIEATLLPTAKFGGFDQRLTLVDLPFLFPNEEVLWKVLDGEIGQEIMSGLENIGIKGIAFYAEGFKAFTNNKPIRKPEDFKGMKIRTMEAPVIMAQYKAWGANPVPIDFAEVYNSLQQKVVDGQENPLLSIHDMKFYEVQKYMIMGDHAYLSYILTVSKKWFDGLSPELQKVIVDTGKEVAQYHKGLMQEANEGYLKNIKAFGTEVIVLSPEEREAFRKASQPVYDEFRNVIGAELLDKTLKFIEENK
ncbi:TRAP transporter substrate-binding protein [Zhaonella formicivorans]|uniref:TRAP transporter substrate-binding protein n=1 Tax=Zhaonella formicivorans TaxID=2528593 RepID=UPI0010E5F8E5|nr:TRAP transporter substrate-binding protein [Zhaonella formicivorans]